MKERPILFSTPMIRALLAGTKTQTRRVVKAARDPNIGCWMTPGEIALDSSTVKEHISPYGQPGDRLWVREAFAPITKGYAYAADPIWNASPAGKWRPSIHMPRAASRIILEITGVRVDRLQDISNDDAYAEGAADWAAEIVRSGNKFPSAQRAFQALWASINGPDAWAANPWVWVVEFKQQQERQQ